MFADATFYFFKQFILIFLDIISFAFLFRVIASLFDPMGESRISTFLYALTEPITLPVRALCQRMNWFQGVPLDIPFTLTWLLLTLIKLLFANL